MPKSLPALLAAGLTLASALGAVAAPEADGFRLLETDPSRQATGKLAQMYRGNRSPFQRVWILRALSLRLRERGDEAAMEPLLLAAKDRDPVLRGPALRGLTGFTSLPKEAVAKKWVSRLEAAVASGAADRNVAVRDGAADLRRALDYWGNPSSRTTPAPPEEPAAQAPGWPRLGRVLRWLWVLLLPSVVVAWMRLGFPLFDASSAEGRKAWAAWRLLARQPALFALTALLWLFLAVLLASYGFDLLALSLGWPMYKLSGGWLAAYAACAACLFLPGAMIAAGFSRDPSSCPSSACLRVVPRALVAGIGVFAVLWPLEAVYRLLLRRVDRGPVAETSGARAFDSLVWTFEAGSLRSGYLAAGVMACEGQGLLPAFERLKALFPFPRAPEGPAGRALGFGAYDPRFILLFAAPMLAFVCALAARGLPVEWRASVPIVLLGCLLWSWTVLAGILFAVLQALEGVGAAAGYLRASGRALPEGDPDWAECGGGAGGTV